LVTCGHALPVLELRGSWEIFPLLVCAIPPTCLKKSAVSIPVSKNYPINQTAKNMQSPPHWFFSNFSAYMTWADSPSLEDAGVLCGWCWNNLWSVDPRPKRWWWNRSAVIRKLRRIYKLSYHHRQYSVASVSNPNNLIINTIHESTPLVMPKEPRPRMPYYSTWISNYSTIIQIKPVTTVIYHIKQHKWY